MSFLNLNVTFFMHWGKSFYILLYTYQMKGWASLGTSGFMSLLIPKQEFLIVEHVTDLIKTMRGKFKYVIIAGLLQHENKNVNWNCSLKNLVCGWLQELFENCNSTQKSRVIGFMCPTSMAYVFPHSQHLWLPFP